MAEMLNEFIWQGGHEGRSWTRIFVAWTRIFVAFGLTVGTALPSDAGTVNAGATRPAFTVSRDGAATLSLSLQVPPGTSGIQPNLSLVYNSQQGDGVLGVGWGLSGISAISRCTATRALDGFTGTIKYDDGDRYCLDGHRLVAVNGASSSEFRTVIDSFTRIVADGTGGPCGAGPCGFVAHQRNGTTVEYETRVNAYGRPDGAVDTWAVSRIVDGNGNAMSFTYDVTGLEGTGSYYLTRIDYTSNNIASPPLKAGRSVVFNYGQRPTYVTRYRNGAAYEWRRQLQSITTAVGTTAAKVYSISYELGPTTGRNRPVSVQECDGRGNCLGPTTLSYGDSRSTPGGFAAQPTVELETFDPSPGVRYLTGDFTGDGLTDIVRIQNSGGEVKATLYARTATGFSVQPVSPSLGTWQPGASFLVGDFNADGMADIAMIFKTGLSVGLRGYMATGTGFSVASWALDDVDWPSEGVFTTGDFDGDGRVDIGVFGKRAGSLSITSLLSSGTGFTPVVWNNVSVEWNGGYILPGNFTTDGTTSIAYIRPSGRSTVVDVVSYNDGKPVSANWLPASAGVEWVDAPKLLAGDFNGDGVSDIARAYHSGSSMNADALVSTGMAFSHVPLASQFVDSDPSNQFFASDLNGDQTTDLVVVSNRGGELSASAYLAQPGASGLTLNKAPWTIDKPGPFAGGGFLAGDFAGLGFSDIVKLHDAGGMLAASVYSLSPYTPASMKPLVPPDLVTRVNDAAKGEIGIQYAPLTNANGTVYRKGSGAAYPEQEVQNGTWVVSAHQISNGRSVTSRYDYSYQAARLSLMDWGWLGFAGMSITDGQTGIVEERTFSQIFPMIGALTGKVTRHGAGGPPITAETTAFTCYTGSGAASVRSRPCQEKSGISETGAAQYFPNVFQVLTTQTTQQAFPDRSTTASWSQVLTYSHDGYGNVLRATDQATGGGTDTRHTCYAVRNDDAERWQLGLVTSAKITTDLRSCADMARWSSPGDLHWSTFGYDGKGNPAYVQNWLAVADPQTRAEGCGSPNQMGGTWLCTRLGVDVFGNVTQVTDPNGNVRTIAYETDFATFPAKTTPPPGQDGADLSVITAFEPLFGRMLHLTDPNGMTTGQEYDGFGRVTSMFGPDPVTGAKLPLMAASYAIPEDGAGLAITVAECSEWEDCADQNQSRWNSRTTLVDALSRPYRVIQTFRSKGGKAIDACSSPLPPAIQADITYDAAGRVLGWTQPYFMSEPAPPYYSVGYDASNRLSTLATPDGITTTWQYDLAGWTTTRTSAVFQGDSRVSVGQSFVSKLDARKRPTTVTASDGGVSTYAYDGMGNLTSVTDPIGAVMSFEWDSAGRLTSVSHPDFGTRAFVYDNNGNVVQATDALGQTIAYQYDGLNRPKTKMVKDGTGRTVRTATFAHDGDSYGGVAVRNGKGRLNGASTEGATYAFSWDAYGALAARRSILDGAPSPFQFLWSRGPRARMDSITFPDGTVVRNSYLGASAICSVSLAPSDGTTQVLASYADHTALMQPRAVTYLNGVRSSFTYDVVGRIASLKASAQGSPALIDNKYVWGQNASNPANVLTKIMDLAATGQSQSFSYDSMGRLLKAQGPYGTASYTYNQGGAITSDALQIYSYPPASYRPTQTKSLSGSMTSTLDFDAIGNLKSQMQVNPTSENPNLLFTFDPEQHLVQAARGPDGASTNYSYDPFGTRLSKTDTDGVVTWYPGPDYTVSQYPGSKTPVVTKTIRGPTGPIAEISN